MRRPTVLTCFVAAILLAACSPTFDWRMSRPEGSGAELMFPCRPASHARTVQLAGDQVELTMLACSAGGSTWALAFADVGDPARVGPALMALREAAVANLSADAATVETLPLTVRGATPQPASARLALAGQLPDGQPVRQQLAVFSKGTRVFQATWIGPQLPAEAVQTFFGALAAPG